MSVARDGETIASLRLPIARIAAFDRAMHAGANAIAKEYNTALHIKHMTDVVVAHRRAGGDVGALLAGAFRALRETLTEPKAKLQQSGDSLRDLAGHLRALHEPVDEAAAGLAELMKRDFGSSQFQLEDRLGRALRAAAEELGGVDALLGDSPSANELRRYMEETGRSRGES